MNVASLETQKLVTNAENTNLRPILNDLITIVTNANNTPSYTPPYKEYVVLLNQTGTAAPVATIISNTLGVTPTLARSQAGAYTITAAGIFLVGKTVFNTALQSCYGGGFVYNYLVSRTSDNVITVDDYSGTDSQLINAIIEIKVYN